MILPYLGQIERSVLVGGHDKVNRPFAISFIHVAFAVGYNFTVGGLQVPIPLLVARLPHLVFHIEVRLWFLI